MSLKEGKYIIRFVPPGMQPPFEGGLYAVASEMGGPILAEAMEPNTPPEVWDVKCQNDVYTIIQTGFQTKNPLFTGPGPVLAGWGLAKPSGGPLCQPILFKVDYQEFIIQPVGEGEHLMYSVQVPNPQPVHPGTPERLVTEGDGIFYVKPYTPGLVGPHCQSIPVLKK